MHIVSSSATLFLKFFIPIFWIVFFGLFNIALWVTDKQVGSLPRETFNIGFTIFFLIGITLLYYALMRLKRVEMDGDFAYVTNYLKTSRYPWHNIEKIVERDYLFFKSIDLYLKTPGQFGKKMTFVASQKRFNEFLKSNPVIIAQFIDSE